MKKLIVATVALIVAAGAAAAAWEQNPPDKKPGTNAAVNVTGKWTMTLEMSMGTGNPTLELKQDGEKVSGSYTGRYGTFPLEGTLKERAIQFSVSMVAEGESVTMAFTGEVAQDAQNMKGNAVLGELGDATWSAKKDKQ